ncbi:MAG: hypothetical protein AAGA77_11920 [Bacteroidota bacterium]
MNQTKLLFVFTALIALFSGNLNGQELTDVNEKLPSFLINEVHVEDVTLDDVYIELVVTKSNEIPHNVNDPKAKIIIDDSNEGTDFKSGYISIRPDCVRDVYPGDIIIIHGRQTDISNVDENVKLFEINDDCIQKWDGVPNAQNPSYTGATINNDEGASINDFFSFNSSQNKIQIRINDIYFNKVHQKNESNYSLHSNDLNDYTNLAKTLGKGNNLANQSMIDNLAGQSKLRIECGLTSTNSAIVKIISKNTYTQALQEDYSGPYTLTTPNYEETGIKVNYATAYGLECGLNTLIVTDQLGRTAQCEVSVAMDNAMIVQTCKESEVDIQKLICENIESDCIYFKNGNQDAITLSAISEIPMVTPEFDDYPVMLKFSDRNGNILHEVSITIDIIYPGDICDDGDECTSNDAFDDSCNCVGTSQVPEIELTVNNEIPCQNSKVTFSVPNIYDEYTWRVDGKRLGDDNTFETTATGLVELTVKKDGCRLKEEHLIPDLTGETVEISTTADVYCNDMTQVTLSIDPDLAQGSKWYDEFGDLPIATDVFELNIPHEGIYRVEIFDCEQEGSIYVRGANNEDYKITPQNPILCDANSSILTLSPTPPASYTISWSTGQTNINSINVYGAGSYGVTVTAKNKCEYVDQVEVMDEFNLESLQNFMEERGFGLLEFDLPESFNKSENNDSRSNCTVDNMAGKDYILEPNITGSPLSLEQVLNDIVNEGCNSCDYEAMGYMQLYECVGGEFDMDGFLSLGNDVDGYVKVLTVEDEASGKLQVYYINTIKASANSLIELNNEPEIVKDVVFDLLCGLKNEESIMVLDYIIPIGKTSFIASNIEFLPPVFLNDPSNGLFETVKIANLLNGRAIILPDPSDINPTQLDEIPINPKLIPLIEYESVEGEIWMYKFLYEGCDPTTSEYLYIYVEDEEKDNFHNILTALTSTDDQEHAFFDINTAIAEEIYLNGDYEVLESLPPCLMGDEILCQLIYETIYPPEVEDATPSCVDIRALALAELIKTNSKDVATKVKKCLLDEIENDPLLIDNIHEVFKYNDPLFESLTHLFYVLELQSTLNTEIAVQKKELLNLYAGFGVSSFSGIFNELDVNVDYSYASMGTIINNSFNTSGVLVSGPAQAYSFQNDFKYYNPYLVKIDNPDFNLPTSGGFQLSSLGVVPGVFIPCAVENTSEKINRQTLITTAFAVGAAFAAADVVLLYNAGELATLRGAFAISDLGIGALDLLTSIEPICQGLDTQFDGWCNNWKAISTEVAIFSVTGRVTSGHYAKMRAMEKAWFEQGSAIRQAIVKKHGHRRLRYNNETVEAALDGFFGSLKKILRDELDILYGQGSNPISSTILDDIARKFPEDGFFLINEELADAIRLTSNNGNDIFVDILNTVNNPEKIGYNLAYVNANHVEAWSVMFSKQPFRTNITLLQRMSDDIALEPLFKTWMKNNPSKLDAWKVWKGTYNSAGDPVKNILGSGKVNNTTEWNQLIGEIEAAGGQVTFRSGDIAYAPGLKKGEPGQLIIDPDASITALRHEHRHFLDDQAAGFKGFEGVFDPNFRVTTEYNAYKLEIEEMLNMGQTSVANQLKTNFQNEVNDIMSKMGTPDQSVLDLIDNLMNL